MKIALVLSLYDEHEYIEATLDNILGMSTHECSAHIYLTGNLWFEEAMSTLEAIQDKSYKIFIHTGDTEGVITNSPSVGTSLIIHDCYYRDDYDVVVAGSPDIRLKNYQDFDVFIDQATPHLQTKYTISLEDKPLTGLRFAFIIYTKLGIETAGYPDFNFAPMARSDFDLHRRYMIAYDRPLNLGEISLEDYLSDVDLFFDPPYGHSVILPTQHGIAGRGKSFTVGWFRNASDRLCRDYYEKKWGIPDPSTWNKTPVWNGIFTHPFNDESIPLKITHQNIIDQSYSRHDRKDLRIWQSI